MSDATRVSIKILGKDYQVSCAPAERAALVSAAELLDARMREIREGGRVIGVERIAVMAALNLANELLHSRERGELLETKARARVRAMRKRIEGALEPGQQLEL